MCFLFSGGKKSTSTKTKTRPGRKKFRILVRVHAVPRGSPSFT